MASPLTNVAANLAPTFFRAGAKDVVAAPDVYGISSDSVINSPVGKFNTFDGSLLNNLKTGSNGILSALASSLKISAGGTQISLQNNPIASRVTNILGQPVAMLSSTLQTSLAQSLNLNASAFNTIEATIGNVTTRVVTGDVGSATSLFNLVNQVTGNRSLMSALDVGPTGAVLSSLVSGLIQLGVPQAIDQIANQYDQSKALQQALINNVAQAIRASDLATIQLAINKLGVGGVLSQVPDAPLQLVKAYRMPTNTPVAKYGALYTQLSGIVAQLDPLWNSYTRNGQALQSLKYFAAMSPDCLKLYKTDPQYATECLIGNLYPSADLVTKLQKEFPYMLKL